jgi:ubiquinone/menaquinone biosynthesis C-methylase UbiE
MSDPLRWPTAKGVLPVKEWKISDLISLDRFYKSMYELHQECHKGLIHEMGNIRATTSLSPQLLEVASGTGWNISNLLQAGFDYYAIDISEPAIAVAIMRYPAGRFLTASIDDASIIASDSFDTVFCASMLEHLPDYRPALRQMIRIARRHLFVTFFEGLAEEGSDHIAQYPFENPDYVVFGKKFAMLQRGFGNRYFWNRYTRQSVQKFMRNIGNVSFQFLDSSNRSYLSKETVLHVSKSDV